MNKPQNGNNTSIDLKSKEKSRGPAGIFPVGPLFFFLLSDAEIETVSSDCQSVILLRPFCQVVIFLFFFFASSAKFRILCGRYRSM